MLVEGRSAQDADCYLLINNPVELTDKIQLAEVSKQEIALSSPTFLEDLTFDLSAESDLKEDVIYIGRITLCNDSDFQHWTFSTHREYLSHFKVIFADRDKVSIKHSGDFEKTKNQEGYFPVQSKYNFVDITIKDGNKNTFYFYFENQRRFAEPRIELSIQPKDEDFYTSLNAWKARTYLVAGLFSFLIILGFTFYINSRDKSFLLSYVISFTSPFFGILETSLTAPVGVKSITGFGQLTY